MSNRNNDDYNKNRSGCLLGMFGIFAGTGGILSYKANKNRKKAEEIRDAAISDYNEVIKNFDTVSQTTKKTISDVVLIKKSIMKCQMKKFLKAYRRLAPQIKLNKTQGLKELQNYAFNEEDFSLLGKSIQAYNAFSDKRLGERAFNVAILMVQDGTVSSLSHNVREVIRAGKINDEELKRKTSDELKIQSIGVIWQFSTLAFEYTLSSVSSYLDSKLAIEKANEFAAELECKKEDVKIRTIQINAINQYAYEHLRLLTKLLPLLQTHVECAVEIIKSKDNIFRFGRIKERKFTQNELEKLAFTYALAGAAKAIIDSPIISKAGNVFDGDKSSFDNVKNVIDCMVCES